MRIGIGVTTYNRPKHIQLWLDQIHKHLPYQDNSIVIATDSDKDRKGIAARKNECLKALQHCDYIFLFDDDCFPIKEGWATYFINASEISKQNHFLYLKNTSTINEVTTFEPSDLTFNKDNEAFVRSTKIRSYNNCGGCMMFMTKEVIEKVGGFGEYGLYGYEHAGYSERIFKAGLNSLGKYLCPIDASKYIYSMDYDFTQMQYQKSVEHKTSINLDEAQESIKVNREKFIIDLQTIYKEL